MKTISKAGIMNKRLRKGYTTGTCATAAAVAAVKMLLTKEIVNTVEVVLPGGLLASFKPVEQWVNDEDAGCGIVKDAGDDPDVTDGITVYARAKWGNEDNKDIKIMAGEGIGIVTKPGLSVSIGEPAINPGPRKMIEDNVRRVLPGDRGVEITIYVPDGAERAKKTFNERLGIVGGISILGTTGIVRPMSVESLKESLLPQVDIAKALGYKTIALVPGNMGAKIAKNKLKFPDDAIIQISNFVGDLLKYSVERGFKEILLLGHIGKISKVAAGHFDTHSQKTESPVEIIKRFVRIHTRDTAPLVYIVKVNTADEAAIGLSKLGYSSVLDRIAEKAAAQANDFVGGRAEVGIAITVLSGDIVATDKTARKIIRNKRW
ncbi:MAG: cobalt-precorrin-5B (C(1))-methyltransferase CbiD [Actinomycetota bacterium]|nr:cobalt-precorrin-5B (C(1))-methyltransferase CbiD [Actinomycetota bacterium]